MASKINTGFRSAELETTTYEATAQIDLDSEMSREFGEQVVNISIESGIVWGADDLREFAKFLQEVAKELN
jgi:hypothetical protein